MCCGKEMYPRSMLPNIYFLSRFAILFMASPNGTLFLIHINYYSCIWIYICFERRPALTFDEWNRNKKGKRKGKQNLRDDGAA